ncbi:hypothetical protein MFMK1_001959 [Metallumcola ferriviriculae]|uniref:Uncharacterized protein n=1 Tax=Metallumcola ferriviriculae TaxID=3039180 RepID=A0AAU0UMI0_9FIRM|nr:hypothetical protein MFMK1_001959 [Desulfitibacteraceae bacterium MK1]
MFCVFGWISGTGFFHGRDITTVWINAKNIGINYWFWAIISMLLSPVGLVGYLL